MSSGSISALTVLAPLRVEAHALRLGLPGARVVRTGMGARRSRRSAQRLRDSDDSVFAVAGLCGGLDPSLEPGDVVVASELRGPSETYPCAGAEALADALRQYGVPVRVGPIRCVERMVRGRERDRLWRSGAVAVDMESLWLAEAAAGRPFAVLRVVVDGPGHELLRPGLLGSARRALRILRRAAPALERWSNQLNGGA